jgi:long-chain fatty acid transport protein
VTRSTRLVPLFALLAVAAPRTAHAGGFLTDRAGADYGTPAMPDGYAVDLNPAALGGMQGTQITLDSSFLLRTIHFTRYQSALSPSDPAESTYGANYVAGNSGANTTQTFIVLPAGSIVTDLGTKNWRLGFASYVAFGGQEAWNRQDQFNGTDAPGAVDGAQRWSNVSSVAYAEANTLALAYRFEEPRISIGVGFTAYYNKVQTVRARDANSSDDMYTPLGTFGEGRAFLNVSGINFGAEAGVYWEPMENHRLRLGLSYKSQPAFGQMRLSGNLYQTFASSAQPAASQSVDFLQTLPDIIRFGGAWRVADDVELRSDVQYERWSVLKQMCVVQSGADCNVDQNGADLGANSPILLAIPRHWRDTVRYRVGLGYWFEKETEIFGSTGFGTGAVPARYADPELFDSFNIFGTLGIRHQFGDHIIGAASYNLLYFLPYDVAPGTSVLNNFVFPTKSPNEDGHYTSDVMFLNVNATYLF